MSWHTAAMREDRKQPYFDAVLLSVSELSGQATRDSLLKLVTEMLAEESDMGNIAWHVDRMVAAMLRDGSLARRGGRLTLTAPPGAQQSR